MFTLGDYRAVIAIADEAHFGRAARRLGCTQPSLSARLRRIENALDLRLFERDRSGVRMTSAGERFVEGAVRIIDAARETEEAARAAQAGFGQTLRIGMTQVSAYQVMVPALDAFRRAHPRVRLRIFEGNTLRLERMLERSQIDVAFLHPPLHAPGLSDALLIEVPLVRLDVKTDDATTVRRPLIRYPRTEAPVLMGNLSRRGDWDGDAPDVEADTMLGALVLNHAGFGPVVTTQDYPSPFETTDAGARGEPTGLHLQTAVAWRRLDRRPLVADLIDKARATA